MPRNLSAGDSGSGSSSESGLGVGWVIVQGIIFVFFVIAMIAGDRVARFTGMVYVQSAGLLLALAGSAISIWSVVQHGRNLSPFPKPVEGAVVLEGGPYRFVRHPMYSGIIVFVLGSSIAYMVPAAMLAAPAFLVFFMAKTSHEEALLIEELPEYRKYRTAVPWRLIPKVM